MDSRHSHLMAYNSAAAQRIGELMKPANNYLPLEDRLRMMLSKKDQRGLRSAASKAHTADLAAALERLKGSQSHLGFAANQPDRRHPEPLAHGRGGSHYYRIPPSPAVHSKGHGCPSCRRCADAAQLPAGIRWPSDDRPVRPPETGADRTTGSLPVA